MKKPYPERRALLEMNVVEQGIVHLARRIVTENIEEIEDFFLTKPSKKGLKGS